jgi:glycerophosphoryl diester phosphodiesterase
MLDLPHGAAPNRFSLDRQGALMRLPFTQAALLFFAALAIGLPSARAVEIACHRGANEYCPENTQAAAAKCVEWGADYVEIDVRTTKDGVMIIMHDPWVNRTTNGKGMVRQLTAEQIDGLDAGSWFDARFAGEKVPRLEPYLRWIKGKAKVYFDVKDADLAALIKLVYDVGLENDSFFWFDNDRKALDFRKLDQKLALKMNAANPEQMKDRKERFAANIVEVGPAGLTPENIQACHELGMKLMVYEPDKNLDTFRKAIELGADLINLDNADAFQAVERELAAKQ